MEQHQVIEVLNGKIAMKSRNKIAELTVQLFDAEAKAELLQDLYNQLFQENENLKNELEKVEKSNEE